MMSFDVVAPRTANIEIHGELGSLVVPDPNHFEGEVDLQTLAEKEWEALPVSAGLPECGAWCRYRRSGRHPRPGSSRARGGELAYHVLDVMESVMASAATGSAQAIAGTVDRPPAVPLQAMR